MQGELARPRRKKSRSVSSRRSTCPYRLAHEALYLLLEEAKALAGDLHPVLRANHYTKHMGVRPERQAEGVRCRQGELEAELGELIDGGLPLGVDHWLMGSSEKSAPQAH